MRRYSQNKGELHETNRNEMWLYVILNNRTLTEKKEDGQLPLAYFPPSSFVTDAF